MTARPTTDPFLSLAELATLASTVAEDVRAGHHEVHADAESRWHVRIRCDDQVDVWLISWTSDQGTQLHDHGGSSGAFTVVSGELSEAVWTPGAEVLQENPRREGDAVLFGEHYVHDVRNLRDEVAVSVHAYSPPLSLMNYYDVDGHQLTRLASVWTDDPEAPAPSLRVAS
ncbi:cysteine dioxygenase family protein [Aeromicrobium sp.]|uniref:cysteine dioxygenase n=1 Tax=Aeromicrobium sp. TaxID=1871063 RepID=UPI0030BC037E